MKACQYTTRNILPTRKGLPACFYRKDAKEARLTPSETDQPRVLDVIDVVVVVETPTR